MQRRDVIILAAYREVKVCEWRASLVIARSAVGEWLSLVEHLVRDQGVGGSNPLSPTNLFQTLKVHFWFSVYSDGVEIVDGACAADSPPAFPARIPR